MTLVRGRVTDGIGGFNGGLDTIDSRRQGSR
jgi:hypothetical protein